MCFLSSIFGVKTSKSSEDDADWIDELEEIEALIEEEEEY